MSEAISFSLQFLILLLFHFLSFPFSLPFSSFFFLFSSFLIFSHLFSSFHIQPSTFIIFYEPLLDAQEHLHLQQFYLALQQRLR